MNTKNKLIINESVDALQIELNGNLDNELARQLEESLGAKSSGKRRIEFHLGDVPLMTADGVRVLLNAYITGQASGCKLHILEPQPDVQNLLNTVGLSELIAYS